MSLTHPYRPTFIIAFVLLVVTAISAIVYALVDDLGPPFAATGMTGGISALYLLVGAAQWLGTKIGTNDPVGVGKLQDRIFWCGLTVSFLFFTVGLSHGAESEFINELLLLSMYSAIGSVCLVALFSGMKDGVP